MYYVEDHHNENVEVTGFSRGARDRIVDISYRHPVPPQRREREKCRTVLISEKMYHVVRVCVNKNVSIDALPVIGTLNSFRTSLRFYGGAPRAGDGVFGRTTEFRIVLIVSWKFANDFVG